MRGSSDGGWTGVLWHARILSLAHSSPSHLLHPPTFSTLPLPAGRDDGPGDNVLHPRVPVPREPPARLSPVLRGEAGGRSGQGLGFGGRGFVAEHGYRLSFEVRLIGGEKSPQLTPPLTPQPPPPHPIPPPTPPSDGHVGSWRDPVPVGVRKAALRGRGSLHGLREHQGSGTEGERGSGFGVCGLRRDGAPFMSSRTSGFRN